MVCWGKIDGGGDEDVRARRRRRANATIQTEWVGAELVKRALTMSCVWDLGPDNSISLLFIFRTIESHVNVLHLSCCAW